MWQSSSSQSLVNTAAGLAIAAFIILGLYFTRDFAVPLTAAALLSFLLQPIVQWLRERGLPRPLAVAGVVVTSVAVLGLAATLLAKEISLLAESLPKYEVNLTAKARSAAERFQGVSVWQNASRVLKHVEAEIKEPKTEAAPVRVEVQSETRPLASLFNYLHLSLAPLTSFVLMFLFTIFILLQYHDLRDRVVRMMGVTEIGRSTQALNEAALDLSKFFRLQATLNVSFGLVVGIALWVIGIPNAALWGTIAALSRFIPYVGGVLAAFFPLLMAASVEPGWAKLIQTGIMLAVAEFVTGQLVEPLLYGAKTRLSPLAVLLSAAFWTAIWGPAGLILAVPLTLGLVVFGEHIPHLSFLRLLLGNEPALSAEQRLYHLLLAGDEAQAAEEASKKIEETSVIKYLDEVCFPALAIAARDTTRGVLRREQLMELTQTGEEFSELCEEIIRSGAHEVGQPTEGRVPAVHIIPGRGPFDQIAAKLGAAALRQSTAMNVTTSESSGLTAISAYVASSPNEQIDYAALVSVGGITSTQSALLVRKLLRELRPKAAGLLRVGSQTDNQQVQPPETFQDICAGCRVGRRHREPRSAT